MRKGIAVSPGVTIGTAYCIHEVFVDPGRGQLQPHEVAGELARFENARKRSIEDLRLLQAKVQQQVGKEAAAIFSVHESILHDAALVGKVRGWIQEEHLTAQAALARLMDHFKGLLDRSHDEYLQERLADIRDVVIRLNSYLSEALKKDSGVLTGPTIVVADELLPSQVVMLGDKPVHGIVTQAGSQTSHAAIIARSRGIPAVSGVFGILRQTQTVDTLFVDGRKGKLFGEELAVDVGEGGKLLVEVLEALLRVGVEYLKQICQQGREVGAVLGGAKLDQLAELLRL